MKTPIELTERIYFKLLLKVGVGLVLLVVLIWGGLHVFHKWQERHLVRRAAGYLAGGDTKTASLTARRAFQLNPENADAARMMAQISERAADGSELEWRRKVVELAPESTEDALALVRSALRANDLGLAENTLRGMSEAARETPGYHAAMGRLLEMRNKPGEAESHWAKAAELAPDDSAYQLQLALVRIASGDPAKREQSLAVLERLRADPARRVAATRALIMDGASRGGDSRRLYQLAKELQAYPDAAFGDRLLYLEILRQLRDPEYQPYLAQLEKEAGANAADAASLLSWTTKHATADAIRFANDLSPEIRAKWPVPLAVAEAYSAARDWPALQAALGSADWAAFDFLRQAYLARALREQQQLAEAEREWAKAQKAASGRSSAVLMLARTVGSWNWDKETIDLLWTLTKTPEKRKEALQLLYQHYANSGDTPGLYRVLLRSTEIVPDDLTMQNNLAQISLLIGADVERARKIAAELYEKEPRNAAFVSTYAFSLFARGDVEGARQALETLNEEQLQNASIAVYYGVVLAAAGEKEMARRYLDLGSKAFLLPEERALVTKAENSLR